MPELTVQEHDFCERAARCDGTAKAMRKACRIAKLCPAQANAKSIDQFVKELRARPEIAQEIALVKERVIARAQKKFRNFDGMAYKRERALTRIEQKAIDYVEGALDLAIERKEPLSSADAKFVETLFKAVGILGTDTQVRVVALTPSERSNAMSALNKALKRGDDLRRAAGLVPHLKETSA